MAWDETKVNMTVSGADLELDEGAVEGYYDTGSQDTGSIEWWQIEVECKVTQTPAGVGHSSWVITIDTSDDNASWNGYEKYSYGAEYSCRYYKIRVTVYGEPAGDQRPKINLLEDCARAVAAPPCPAAVTSIINAPAGTETRGVRHIVGVGAGDFAGKDGWLVECEEGDGPSWRFTNPQKGQRVFNNDTDTLMMEDENGDFVIGDCRKVAPFKQYIPGHAWDSAPQGTWAHTVNATQDSCGYAENTGSHNDLDNITFKVGLLIGTYDLRMKGVEGPDQGIVKIYFGATLVATFDTYAAGPANNVLYTQASIGVTTAGTVVVTFKVDGKNGASSDHIAHLSWIDIAPA